jgi:formylglycine-generating enzyme required for sulfatase activity
MKPAYFLFISILIAIPALPHKKPKSGQTFRDCPTCPEMIIIPAGSFIMGSPENEPGRTSNPEDGVTEGPQRLVNIRQFGTRVLISMKIIVFRR